MTWTETILLVLAIVLGPLLSLVAFWLGFIAGAKWARKRMAVLLCVWREVR